MSRSGTYTDAEVRPAGDAAKLWRLARCNGDNIIVGVFVGRLYTSADRGVNWSEQRPKGDTNGNWDSGDVTADGKMIAGESSGRLWMQLSGSWAEVRPGGVDANFNWRACSLSPDGSRAIALQDGGRLYSYYDGVWTEQQPAGAVNKNWESCDINNAGDMIAGVSSGRLYAKSAGGSWAEQQPFGAADKSWNDCAISADGTIKVAICSNSIPVAYYSSGAWAGIQPLPQYASTSGPTVYSIDMSADGTKIIGADSYIGFTNIAMNEISSRHNWSNFTSGECAAGLSADATLAVRAFYNGRVYVSDKDTLPSQVAGGYYKEFTYTRAAGAAYNFKVRVKVYNKYSTPAYLHCEGRANDDFSDIYFKNVAGDTLRHCMVKDESYCNSFTRGYYRWVWVELDVVGATPTTFRMYYGDPGHADSSTAPDSFFDLYDDFERGVDGDAVGGSWTVSRGTGKIETSKAWRGTRSGYFAGATAGGILASVPATAGDDTYIGFWGVRHSAQDLTAAHGDGTTYAKWSWGSDGTLKNYTGGAYGASLASPDYNYWQLFEMCGFSWSADTYDLYQNSALCGNDLAMQASSGFTNVLHISQAGASSIYFIYVDSLIVCLNCNGYASPDSGSISVEMTVEEGTYSGPAGVKAWNEIASSAIKTWNDIAWSTIKSIN